MGETPVKAENGKQYYKILIDGRSCYGGRLTWSLPSRGKPGDWHEVSGDLKRCVNGLHLTSEPTYYRKAKSACYLAEYEGDSIGPFGGEELVVRRCRLVRLAPWSELAKPDPELPPEPPKDSPALVLLRHAWKHQGEGMSDSWRRLNSAMQGAFTLAIEHGVEFGEDDLSVFAKDFKAALWWGDLEHYYRKACEGNHGPNPSAIKAIEKHKGRKPWIVMEDPGKPRVRLSVGSRFRWFDDPENPSPKEAHWVVVTSFDDADNRLIACSYADGNRSKIARRFAIGPEDVSAYHKAVAKILKERDAKSKSPEPAPSSAESEAAR